MGQITRLWRPQPGRACAFRHLLHAVPSTVTETDEICNSVSLDFQSFLYCVLVGMQWMYSSFGNTAEEEVQDAPHRATAHLTITHTIARIDLAAGAYAVRA